MNKTFYAGSSLQFEGPGVAPNEAQRSWAATPVYVLVLIVGLAGMLWLALPMVAELLGADTTTFKSWLVIVLVIDGSLFALLSIAARLSTGSWILRIGPKTDRRLALHALWAGLPLLCLAMVLFYSLILLSSSASLTWVSSWLTNLVHGVVLPETGEWAEWAAMIALDVWFVTITPVVIELCFRGYLLHRLVIRCGAVLGIILTSVAFSLFYHDFVGAFLFSVVLCLMVLNTGSIRWAIIAHASTSALSLILTYVESFYPFDQSSELYSLEYFQNTMWFGILCGLAMLPWLVWIWSQRQRISRIVWATPLIETVELRAQGILGYLIGFTKSIAAAMSLLMIVLVGQLAYVALKTSDGGINPSRLDAGHIDPVDIDRFAHMAMGTRENIRALADIFCSLDSRASNENFITEMTTATAGVLDIPMPQFKVRDLGWALGEFSASSWSISIDRKHFAERHSSKRDRIDFYNTLAHELRHAEQSYIAARYQVAALGYPFLIIFPDYFPNSPLPHSVRMQAFQEPSVEGDKDFEFGQFMSAVDSNDEIARKRRQIQSVLGNWFFLPMSSYYSHLYRDELPSERDAFAIGNKLEQALEECWQRGELPQLKNKLADNWSSLRSGRNDHKVNVTFSNRTSETLSIYWIDFRGQRNSYGDLAPGRERKQSTFEGHLWELETESGELFGRFVAIAEDSVAELTSRD